MTHELKIQKQWADAKLAGEKPFEIRRNDRGFQKGDTVRYKVVDPKTGEPWVDNSIRMDDRAEGLCETGAVGIQYVYDEMKRHPLERCDFLITYVIEGKDGLEKGYCVYADVPVPRKRAAKPEMGFETMYVSPVSADLGSGATPSNGTAEPLAPPSPLAES